MKSCVIKFFIATIFFTSSLHAVKVTISGAAAEAIATCNAFAKVECWNDGYALCRLSIGNRLETQAEIKKHLIVRGELASRLDFAIKFCQGGDQSAEAKRRRRQSVKCFPSGDSHACWLEYEHLLR